jgi:hypothetical protein
VLIAISFKGRAARSKRGVKDTMRALHIEARRRQAFAHAFRAAAHWLGEARKPRRAWHDDRERRAFLAELEDRKLRHLVGPGGRPKFM